jgi:hypothetical protein
VKQKHGTNNWNISSKPIFGCDSSFPDRDLERHCVEFLQPHLLMVLKAIHKKDRSEQDLKDLAQKLEKVLPFSPPLIDLPFELDSALTVLFASDIRTVFVMRLSFNRDAQFGLVTLPIFSTDYYINKH